MFFQLYRLPGRCIRPVCFGVVVLLLSGCSSMQPAQVPDVKLESAHEFGVTKIAFAPHGKRIASGGFKGDVTIREVPSGKILGQFQHHRQAVRGLLWLSENVLVSAGEEGTLSLVDLARGGPIGSTRTEQGLTSLIWLRNSNRLVAGFENGRLLQLSLPGLEQQTRRRLDSDVLSLAAHPDGKQFAVSLDDQQVLLMDEALQPSQTLERPAKSALELSFSPDGKELAAGAWYQVYYWDLASGRLRQQETESWGAVISVDYHPQGGELVTLGRHTDANLRLVNKQSGQVLRRLQAHRLCGAAVRFSPDGRFVASGSDDESLRFYDLSKPYQPQDPGKTW